MSSTARGDQQKTSLCDLRYTDAAQQPTILLSSESEMRRVDSAAMKISGGSGSLVKHKQVLVCAQLLDETDFMRWRVQLKGVGYEVQIARSSQLKSSLPIFL